MVSVQVPTRLDHPYIDHLDELVAAGFGATRSHVIRVALAGLYDVHRRALIGAQIVASYTAVPQASEDDEWAQASLDDWFASEDSTIAEPAE